MPVRRAAAPGREATPKTADTTVRLFVSSTFKDMQEEREALRRDVWPAIRRACEERGTAFIEVDLRWGVTGEEAQRDEVLRICLDEIDRCRPWIMGFLGNRYGWINPNTALRLADRESFHTLQPYSEASVTELELRYAIANRPSGAAAPIGLLYLRKADPLESPFATVIRDLTLAGQPVRPTPDDAQAFAAEVRRDLLALIAQHVPERPAMTRAERRSRLLIEARGRNTTQRPEANRLFELMQKIGGRVAVTGIEGGGKSAIIADATRRLIGRGDVRVLASLSPGGFQPWTAAFLDVLAQLGTPVTSIVGKADLARHFAKAIATVAATKPVCVILDDVESDNDAWLPGPIANATFVVGLGRSPGTGWKNVEVGIPTLPESRDMVAGHLLNFARRLDDGQLARLCGRSRSARATAMLAEELRHIPRWEDLDAAVDRLAALPDIESLAEHVVNRVVKDRGPATPGLLLALAVSRNGLSEEVLWELASLEVQSCSRLEVGLLLNTLGEHMIEAEGRFCFREAALRDAVLVRFGIKDAEERLRWALADAALRRIAEPGAAEEAVEQLAALGDQKALEGALATPMVAEVLLRRDPDYYAAAWGGDVPEPVFEAWRGRETPDCVALAAEFLMRKGSKTARDLAQDVLKRGSEAQHPAARLRALGVLARLSEGKGEFDDAKTHLEAIGELAARCGLPGVAALMPVNSLRLDFTRGGHAAVAGRIDIVRPIAESSPDGRALMTLTLVEGLAALEARNRKEAVRCFEAVKRLALRDGDLTVEASADAGLARVAHTKGKMAQAEALARRVLMAGEVLNDVRLRTEGLAVLALVASENVSRHRESLVLIGKRKALAEAVEDTIACIEADFDKARLLARHRDTKEFAIQLAQDVERRCEDIGLTRLKFNADLRSVA